MTRPKVLFNHPPLHPVVQELLAPHVEIVVADDHAPDALVAAGAGAAVVVSRGPGTVPRPVLEKLSEVRAVVCSGSGTDTVDLAEATELGIAVVNNAGTAPGPVAEYAIAATLYLLKRLGPAERSVRAGEPWAHRATELRGREAGGRTMGVIGFGHIGRDVARRARLGLDMTVLAHDPVQPPEVFIEHGATAVGLDELLAGADVVSVHVPLLPSTAGLLDERAIGLMRPGAVLVNSSRGGVVDEDALYRALESGHLAGAALDVFAEEPVPPHHPLFTLPTVLVTPHIAGITEEATERLSRGVAANVLGLLRGERSPNLVNPQVWPPRRGLELGWPLATP